MIAALLLVAVLFVAAANGANDNFKGVATLYGSGLWSYRASLAWASVTTLAGALCSAWLATALLAAFTGKGLVPAAVATQAGFALSVAAGAGVTVALAGWRGLPVSTTHALVGAMCGAGWMAVGSGVALSSLGVTFLLPLLVSPLLAMLPAWLLAPWLQRLAARAAALPAQCLCVETTTLVPADSITLMTAAPTLSAGADADCAQRGAQRLLTIDARRITHMLHVLLAGTVGFSRGLNDTPKIAALLLPLAAFGSPVHGPAAVAAVAVAMLIGGLIGARRVARTLSLRITRLDLGTSLSASLVTSLLVSTASINGLPVSTTHVAVGALTGAGLRGGRGVDRGVLGGIALAWFATLPLGAACGALIYSVIGG